MAQLLINTLVHAGFQPELASRLRVFVKDPDDHFAVAQLKDQAQSDSEQLADQWQRDGPPALWFCYHPYYKSPDLIGPALCQAFNVPYVTAEASYSRRRSEGVWESLQKQVVDSVKRAAVNICFTARDFDGLHKAAPTANLARLPPFIETSSFSVDRQPSAEPQLVTVAMMRSGDKLESYTQLAASLSRLLHTPWTLSVVGDGPASATVKALFAEFPEHRIRWLGQLERAAIAALFATSSLFVWPGCGEAYGLAYLEAQAAGLPVVAFDTAGVPEVVSRQHGGTLTPVGDERAFAAAIEELLGNTRLCNDLSRQARHHVHAHHGFEQASKALHSLLRNHIGSMT